MSRRKLSNVPVGEHWTEEVANFEMALSNLAISHLFYPVLVSAIPILLYRVITLLSSGYKKTS